MFEGIGDLDIYSNIFLLSSNDESFAKDIENVSNSDLRTTLIFNKHKLSDENFLKAIKIALEVGIKNFQFGDGFGNPIKSIDLSEIKKLMSNNNFIKIVGGVKNINQVVDLLNAGADCVGTSNFNEIFQELKSNGK